MPRKIEISHRTIVFTFFLFGLVWFLYQIRDLILILFVALLLVTILNPLIKKLSRLKIPRGVSILIVYLLFIVLTVLTIASIVPVLVVQTSNFATGLPAYFESLNVGSVLGPNVSNQIVSQLGSIPGEIVQLIVSIFSNLLSILTVLTFAFYLLLVRNKLDTQLSTFLGDEKAGRVVKFVDELEVKLGGWARGQLFLMLTVGVLDYLGMKLLGVPYALPLGILAGLLEVVPYIGPVLAAIPAIIIGFGVMPVVGIATAVVAFLIQQIENYILVPKIMERSVGVSPIIVLLALSIGFRMAGIAGILISIPVVITLRVLAGQKFLKLSKI